MPKPLLADITPLLVALLATPAFAQSTTPGDAALQTVSVTGTRSARGPQTLAATTVITREEIERLAPPSLPELLRGQPGIAITNQGGAGKLSALFLRGTGSGQVQVLIDGVRIGSPTAGMAALQDIPVEQIERVEIVRGPMSVLYGSDAIGGVIQIFTRRPQVDGVHLRAGAALGSQDTWKADVGVDGRQSRGWYSATVARERTRGINACSGDAITWSGCGVNEPDRDGYHNTSLSVSGGVRFNSAWNADAHALRVVGDNAFDGGWANHSHNLQQVVGAHVQFAPGERLAFDASIGRNDDHARNYSARGVDVGYLNTRRESASLKADIGSRMNLASIGVDWQRDGLRSDTAFDRTRRFTRGLFADWRAQFGAQQLQLGARREQDSQFGGHTTGHLGWGWDLAPSIRLIASAGTAFRAPTFNDLYYPGSSNPNLKPETSRNFELGVDGAPGWGRWSVHAYQNRLNNLIVWNSARTTPATPWGSPDNVQRAEIRGVEATLGTTLADWDINATASWIDPRNRTPGGLDGKLLARRAQRIARIDADRRFGLWSIGASVNGSSGRFDDPANRVHLAGFATTDLRLGFQPASDWALRLSAQNIFDRKYETARWYNQPGRSVMLSVRYAPR